MDAEFCATQSSPLHPETLGVVSPSRKDKGQLAIAATDRCGNGRVGATDRQGDVTLRIQALGNPDIDGLTQPPLGHANRTGVEGGSAFRLNDQVVPSGICGVIIGTRIGTKLKDDR